MVKHLRNEGAGFGKFPAWVVDKGLLSGLTHNELRLYCLLVTRAWNTNRLARLTHRDVERGCGIPERASPAVTRGLVKKGLVKVWRHGRGLVFFVPDKGPLTPPRDTEPISPPRTPPGDPERIPPRRDRQGRFDYASSPGDTESRTPRDTESSPPRGADPLNTSETMQETFQREQGPLSQFSGEEDGPKAQDGPLAETVAEELEQAQVRPQEEPAPQEPAGLVDGPPDGPEEQAAAKVKMGPVAATAWDRVKAAHDARQDPARGPPGPGEN